MAENSPEKPEPEEEQQETPVNSGQVVTFLALPFLAAIAGLVVGWIFHGPYWGALVWMPLAGGGTLSELISHSNFTFREQVVRWLRAVLLFFILGLVLACGIALFQWIGSFF